MSKKKLEKRLSYLYSGELSATILFIFVSYYVDRAFPNLQLYSLYSFWISFFLLEFLLLQGTIYWYSKLKRLRIENMSMTPVWIVRLLKRLKLINIILVFVSIVMFVIDFVQFYSSLPIKGLITTVFIYIFAVLEFINYFYIQLSYDNISDIKYLLKTKKLKQSCIRKDFQRIL
ncbi:general stress protein [Lysinibacillus sp. NPDC047702]|uniref:general stress protein n=1 Tax=unclassified Lysinibacillus TaxID=2636778 RepID=UPI003D04DB36